MTQPHHVMAARTVAIGQVRVVHVQYWPAILACRPT